MSCRHLIIFHRQYMNHEFTPSEELLERDTNTVLYITPSMTRLYKFIPL